MLTEAQRLALFVDMHRSIEQAAARAVSQFQSPEGISLHYPPDDSLNPLNGSLTDDEIAAITDSQPNQSFVSALRKIIMNACSEPIYQLFCILDGIADPISLDELWLGARIEPVPKESVDSKDVEPLRYDFCDAYWAWQKKRAELE